LREQNQVDDISPQPSLKQLDILFNQMRLTGLSISFKIEGEEMPLRPGVDLFRLPHRPRGSDQHAKARWTG